MTVKSEYHLPEKIVIGTRGSPLALWQANRVKELIVNVSKDIHMTLEIIRTTGDWSPSDGECSLNAVQGGKALFAKEIEESLLDNKIDIAVHSMKDMEVDLPEGLVIPFMLPRASAGDVVLSNDVQNIYSLPDGCVVGTVSPRRAAFLHNKRPDLRVVPMRGNVETRLQKLKDGQVGATILAQAGLDRLGVIYDAESVINPSDMLPAVGQGAIGIETRISDVNDLLFMNQFSCIKTMLCVECERSVLRAISGSCHTPVGVHATLSDGVLSVKACLLSLDGAQKYEEYESHDVSCLEEANDLGKKVGESLRLKVPEGIL